MKTTLISTWIVLWPVLRQMFGWVLIGIGILGLVLPILNGVIPLFFGVLLVGRRNCVIRWVRARCKLLIRRWAMLQTPIIGPLGRLARRTLGETSRQQRRMIAWYEARKASQTLSNSTISPSQEGS